jgi:hypothetical protein
MLFAMEPAMTMAINSASTLTAPAAIAGQSGEAATIRTASELRDWLCANHVHGLSAGRSEVRGIEATSATDGTVTSLEVPTDLFRALAPEMVWMHEVDTLPGGVLLALRSQLDAVPAPLP